MADAVDELDKIAKNDLNGDDSNNDYEHAPIKSETSDKKRVVKKIEKVFFELGLKCAYFLNQAAIENRVSCYFKFLLY